MRPFVILLQLFFVLTVEGYCQTADTVSLNGSWKFKIDRLNKGLDQKWFRPGLDDSGWNYMEVPGNWDLHNKYDHYIGKAWYRHTFEVPEDWEKENVRLVFGGVYNDTKIWLNGRKIGEHHFGYRRFYFDISPYLKYGKPNELAIRVDNSFKVGALWNWGGIRRPVWLEITPKIRLNLFHITAVPDLHTGTAQIRINFEVDNKTRQDQKVDYTVNIVRNNKIIWSSDQHKSACSIIAKASGSTEGDIRLHFPASKVKLWSFDDPNLYEAEIKISRNGKVLHHIRDQFGIRKIAVDGEQLKLNGKPIRPVGFNLVPDDRTTGSTLPLWRIKKDVDMMKAAGANMARLSHLPLPKSFLNYLDQKGIMVIEAVSLWGKNKWVDPDAAMPKYLLKYMIRQEYNHPSVIGWSVGNEIGYVKQNPKVMNYIKEATSMARKLDSTRLVEYVSNSAQNQKVDPVQYVDLILQNSYGDWGHTVEKTHKYHPGKPIFMSEIGNHLNSEDPNKGTINFSKILGAVRHKPYVIGASLWTFNDYRSTWQAGPTWATPPSENRTWGVVNVFRQKKRAYYAIQRAYLPFDSVKVRHSSPSLIPGEHVTTSLTLNPRDKDDFPIYTLKNYRFAWQVRDTSGKIIDGGFEKLPKMNAGDNPYSTSFDWKVPERDGQVVKISLLDSQSYAIYDTTFYLKPPDKPKIVAVYTGTQGIRVVYKKQPTATAYKVRYRANGLVKETDPTIDNFINISGLKYGQTYHLQLVAINNAGETKTKPFSATVDSDELPPVIWHTEPSDSSFFIGYSVDKIDLLYEIEYGTSPGAYTDTLLLQTKGVCQIPNLEAGKTYYYRFRRHMQWGFASEWSREIAVTTDKVANPDPPVVHGAIRKGNNALLFFNPVHKAIGYKIRIKSDGGEQLRTVDSNVAYVNQILISDLDSNKNYTFAVQAITSEGKSNFVPFRRMVKNK
jgi:hypothetical protein